MATRISSEAVLKQANLRLDYARNRVADANRLFEKLESDGITTGSLKRIVNETESCLRMLNEAAALWGLYEEM